MTNKMENSSLHLTVDRPAVIKRVYAIRAKFYILRYLTIRLKDARAATYHYEFWREYDK